MQRAKTYVKPACRNLLYTLTGAETEPKCGKKEQRKKQFDMWLESHATGHLMYLITWHIVIWHYTRGILWNYMSYWIAMVICTKIDLQKNSLKYKIEIDFNLGYHKLDNNVTTPLPAQRWLLPAVASYTGGRDLLLCRSPFIQFVFCKNISHFFKATCDSWDSKKKTCNRSGTFSFRSPRTNDSWAFWRFLCNTNIICFSTCIFIQ